MEELIAVISLVLTAFGLGYAIGIKHIELATQEDKKWKLDYWASLFKSTTWEELKMLAQQSQVLKEAVETIYDLTVDEAIREQCKATRAVQPQPMKINQGVEIKTLQNNVAELKDRANA